MKERKLGDCTAQPWGNAQWVWWSQQLQDNGSRLGLFLLDVNNQLNVWDFIIFPPCLLPPLSSTLEIFPKRKSFPFLLAELITVIIFSFISEQVSFGSLWWLPLSTVIVLLWLSDLQLGHTRHCETWESIYQCLHVGKGSLTSCLLDVEAGSISPRVILGAEIWIWTGHSFRRWKINSKCFHPIRCNEKKYIIKMIISAPITESLLFLWLFSQNSPFKCHSNISSSLQMEK